MTIRIVLLFAAFGACATAAAENIEDRWNLSEIYSSTAAWDADADKLTAQMKEFAACKGHLGDSVVRFRKCLDLQADMTKRYYRLLTYSNEQLSGDTSAGSALALNQKTEILGAKLSEATSFMEPELQKLGSAQIARNLAQEPALKIYRHPLDETLRAAPHTLNTEGEALVAQFGLMNDAGNTAFQILTDADIPWPTIKLSTGEEVRLDESAYSKYITATNRDDRKKVMDTLFGMYKTYERTLGVTLYSQLKQDTVYSKVRKYPDSLARTLDANRVPVAVLDTLIAQTNANLPTLHRYLRLRAKMLGITDLKYYDTYPPIVTGKVTFPLATAKQLVLDAVAPLGPEYVAAMKAGFDSRWMDTYPRPNKQSGAHMSPFAYDVHPYVLMNYNDDYDSVTTVAHEWGHAMHSYLANRAQPFVTANYPIFIGEIASTFNEQLLLEQMLKRAKTDEERLYYLGTALDGLRATFFRQAMFAEFERNVHARVDKGEPLTGEMMTSTYCDILKRYQGVKEGVMAIDDAYCIEWARIPHFYSAFYVYQYATSLAASALFAQKVGKRRAGRAQALSRAPAGRGLGLSL